MNNFNKIKIENNMKRTYTSSSPKKTKDNPVLKIFPKHILPTFSNYNIRNPPHDIVITSNLGKTERRNNEY